MDLQTKAHDAFSPTPDTPLTIGTRGSPLALAQAHEVRNRLMEAHGLTESCFVIEIISTAGDRIQDRSLSAVGGKGLFTEEIEDKLLSGALHIAVHSSKDMPTRLPDGLELSTFLPREDVRDAFLSHKASSLMTLPEGAVVGTASLRRQAMVRRLRPDLTVVNFRGNVQTRMQKLQDNVVDATLLACAGLNRLNLAEHVTEALDPEQFVPAIGQGAVCIEIRSDAHDVRALLNAIHHPQTALELATERSFLRELDGSCRTPIAGRAICDGITIAFHGMVLSPDGETAFAVQPNRPITSAADAVSLGQSAGEEMRAKAGDQFLADVIATEPDSHTL